VNVLHHCVDSNIFAGSYYFSHLARRSPHEHAAEPYGCLSPSLVSCLELLSCSSGTFDAGIF